MNKVVACIDGASYTEGVCDYAAWAAMRMDVPLEVLHVLVRSADAKLDASGTIGLGARESLLEELAALDQRRNTLAREHGQLMLERAKQRALSAGAREVNVRQRHGELVETLAELSPDTRLYVLGQHDYDSKPKHLLLDHNLENAVRAQQRPILIATAHFTMPQSFMIAFDGSATARKMVEMVADSALLRGLECTIATVGGAADSLYWATGRMTDAGFQVTPERLDGDPADALTEFAEQKGIHMLVMGAYGHSRIRQLVVGSTTTAILRRSKVPVFILR